MKRFVVFVVLVVLTSGCDRVGAQFWHPAPDTSSYGTWTHDDTDNGCNEWNTEPAAEVDNDGVLCVAVVP